MARGNVWGDDGRQAVATAWQRRGRWKAVRSCHAVCRFRADREKAAIRSRRCVMASPPPCRQRKNNSHCPDPPAFGRLRTGREAPHTPKARRVFCRWPPRCLKKSPCAVPGNFAQDVSSEASEKSPCPVPCVCVSLSRLYLDCGKEFVRCPACVVVRVRQGLQEFGACSRADRFPPRGQGRSKSNALAASDRSRSGRESL